MMQSEDGQITRSDVLARMKDTSAAFYYDAIFWRWGAVLTTAALAILETFPQPSESLQLEKITFFCGTLRSNSDRDSSNPSGHVVGLAPYSRIRLSLPFLVWGVGNHDVLGAPYGASGIDRLSRIVVSCRGAAHGVRSRNNAHSDFNDDSSDYAPNLHELLARYKRWIAHDVVAASTLTFTLLAIASFGMRWNLHFHHWVLPRFEVEALGLNINPISLNGFTLAASGLMLIALFVIFQSTGQYRSACKWLRETHEGSGPLPPAAKSVQR